MRACSPPPPPLLLLQLFPSRPLCARAPGARGRRPVPSPLPTPNPRPPPPPPPSLPFRTGDIVEVVVNSMVHKGMPHKTYHGRTGIVFNVAKKAVGVEVRGGCPCPGPLRCPAALLLPLAAPFPLALSLLLLLQPAANAHLSSPRPRTRMNLGLRRSRRSFATALR